MRYERWRLGEIMAAIALAAAAALLTPVRPPASASTSTTSGYWMLGANGKVFPFGSATWYGDFSSYIAPGYYATHIEPTSDGHGYWLTDFVGHVYTFGDARGIPGSPQPGGNPPTLQPG